MNFAKLFLVSFQFKPILSLFYNIVRIWTIDQDLFEIRTCQLGLPMNVDLLFGLVIIFICELLLIHQGHCVVSLNETHYPLV